MTTTGPPYKSGYRRYRWHDGRRERPVWGDVWYPSRDAAVERPIEYGLGGGHVIAGAALAGGDGPYRLAVLSHGAFGSAGAYAWLSEYLARSGFVVLGVCHYGESPVYGLETIEPTAAARLWTRPQDCIFAIDRLLASDDFARRIDDARIAAIGHSSGGATAVALAGAPFDAAALSTYCASDDAREDRGCQYGRQPGSSAGPSEDDGVGYDPRIKAIVMMDPAGGPGFSVAGLARVGVPALVIASEDNDFLPFRHHAGRYAASLPHAWLVALRSGEGHFVYVNECASDLRANGVPLCVDRDGVDRGAVHAFLAERILAFLTS